MLSGDYFDSVPAVLPEEKGHLESGDKKVRIIYLVPSDSIENPDYKLSLENAARHLRRWYSKQLGNSLSFNLNDPIVEVYRTSHEAAWYSTHPNGSLFSTFWNNVLSDGFLLTGGRKYDPDNIWVFYIDALNACGQCGGCGGMGCVVISANDLRGLVGLPWIPICPGEGRSYTPCRYVGGLGHELGHAFGVPHPPGCEDQQPWCDYNSIMWTGYAFYPNCYFSDAEKSILLNSDFISQAQLSACEFDCVDLLIAYEFKDTVTFSICAGDSILLGGQYRSEAGTYCDSLLTVNGCDSIIISELSLNQTYKATQLLAQCEGDSILLGGQYRTEAGTYYDSLLTVKGCDSIIVSELTLDPLPPIELGNDTLITTKDMLLLNAGTDALVYKWSDGSSGQALLLQNLPEGEYEYSVSITDDHHCRNADTIRITVIAPSDVSNHFLAKTSDISLYPNPGQEIIYIETSAPGYYSFSIFSCEGVLVCSGESNDHSGPVDISYLKKGLYFITIRLGDLVVTRKIIKQ